MPYRIESKPYRSARLSSFVKRSFLPGSWLILSLFSPPLFADPELDQVRANMVNAITAASASRQDPLVINSLNNLRNDALNRLNSMQSDGRWTDINYTEVPSGVWSVANHYSRIYLLARAYRTPGQSLYNDTRLRDAVERGLTYASQRIYAGCPTPGNWWYWEVELPYYSYGPTLVIMRGHMNATLFNTHSGILNYLVGLNIRQSSYSGENLIWKAMTRLYAGIVRDNVAIARQAQSDIASACAFVGPSADGIMPDYSFHQHGRQLQTGGYGADFGKSIGDYFLYTSGTDYTLSPSAFSTYVNYVAEGIRWAMLHNYFDPSTIGREITRSGSNAGRGLEALAIVGNFVNPRRDECIAAAKKMLQTYSSSFGVASAGLISQVLASSVTPEHPMGHKHFWRSDYTVHRAPGWMASIKMFSTRIISAEEINDEGLRSWHLSDGMMHLVRNGNEYYRNNVWPTLDWERLPGISTERRARARREGFGLGTRSFVGGVAVGDTGVTAMDYRQNASNLSSRRSWHFLGEEIVVLGSQVTCPSTNRVETIINQWPLESGTSPLTVNGTQQPTSMPWEATLSNASWAHCDGIGYVFPGGQSIKARREIRTGRWSDLGIGSSTQYTNPILTLWYDHGTNPNNQRYSYVILPNKSSAQTAAYASANPVTILSGQGNVHAVKHNTLNAVGVVFWAAGQVDMLQSQDPCVAYYQTVGNTLTLAVSDPAHTGQNIRLTFNQRLTPTDLPPEVTATPQAASTLITVRPQEGRTYIARFQLSVERPGPPQDVYLFPLAADSLMAGWSPVNSAVSYRVDLAADPDFTQMVSGYNNLQITETSVVFAELQSGAGYYVRVRAENGSGGVSDNSIAAYGQTLLHAPLNVVARGLSDHSVQGDWQAVEGAAAYRVDLSTSDDFSSILPAYNNLPIGSNSAVFSGLAPSTRYYLRVRTEDAAGGISANSEPAACRTLIAAPQGVRLRPVSTSSLEGSWPEVPSAVGYWLDLALDPNFNQILPGHANQSVESNQAVFTGLQPNTDYYLRVRAGNGFGDVSGNSDAAQGRTLSFINPPSDVRLQALSTDSLEGAWAPVQSAVAYRVELSLNRNFTQILPAYDNRRVDGDRFTFTGLRSCTRYYLRVRSEDGEGGWSAPSEVAEAKTLLAPPQEVVLRSVSPDTLEGLWRPVESAVSYRIDLATDRAFTQILPAFSNRRVDGAPMTFTALSPNADYYLRVRSESSEGDVSSNSAVAHGQTRLLPLVIASDPVLPLGQLGRTYTVRLAAEGGLPPYTWTMFSGHFPEGLTLESSGIITGAPKSEGLFKMILQVTDRLHNNVTKGFSLTVGNPSRPPEPPKNTAGPSSDVQLNPSVVTSNRPVQVHSTDKINIFKVFSVVDGRLVMEKHVEGVTDFDWDLAGIHSGYYMVVFGLEGGKTVQSKLVVIR